MLLFTIAAVVALWFVGLTPRDLSQAAVRMAYDYDRTVSRF